MVHLKLPTTLPLSGGPVQYSDTLEVSRSSCGVAGLGLNCPGRQDSEDEEKLSL